MSEICSVVIADDNCEAADTLVEILSEMGYRAIGVDDGKEAVNACAMFEPELLRWHDLRHTSRDLAPPGRHSDHELQRTDLPGTPQPAMPSFAGSYRRTAGRRIPLRGSHRSCETGRSNGPKVPLTCSPTPNRIVITPIPHGRACRMRGCRARKPNGVAARRSVAPKVVASSVPRSNAECLPPRVQICLCRRRYG